MEPTEEIRAVLGALKDAWDRGDAEGWGALFTEDCDYVAFDGAHLIGRGSNVAAHRELFAGMLEGTRLVADIGRVRFLNPELAIVVGSGAVLWPWQPHPPRGRLSRQTYVIVRRPAGWKVAAFHGTRINPVPTAGPRVLALMRMWVRVRKRLAG